MAGVDSRPHLRRKTRVFPLPGGLSSAGRSLSSMVFATSIRILGLVLVGGNHRLVITAGR